MDLVRVRAGRKEIILVGTAHVSKESVEEVRKAITEEKPDRVCVELDYGRYNSLTQGSSWKDLNIGKVLKDGKGFLLLANLVLSSFQKRLGSDIGVKPGEDMLAAVRTAQEMSIPYALCDRDIQITLRRAWSRTGSWGKTKMLAAMVSAVFTDEKLDEQEIEKLKQKDVLATMLEEALRLSPPGKARSHRRKGPLPRFKDLPVRRQEARGGCRCRTRSRNCGEIQGSREE